MTNSTDAMVRCRYAGTDPDVIQFLINQGSTQVEVPMSVLNAGGGGQWIERSVRSQIASQAAELEKEAADRAVLEARAAEQAMAEAATAEQARIAADERRRAELRAELKGDVDRLASTNIQAAAALQSQSAVIDESCARWREEANGMLQQLRAEKEELLAVKVAVQELLIQVQKAQGQGALSTYELSRRIEKVERKLTN